MGFAYFARAICGPPQKEKSFTSHHLVSSSYRVTHVRFAAFCAISHFWTVWCKGRGVGQCVFLFHMRTAVFMRAS